MTYEQADCLKDKYALSDAAEKSLREILARTQAENGVDVATRLANKFASHFVLLAADPEMGTLRPQLTASNSLRVWPVDPHLIFYDGFSSPIRVIAICDGAMNPWVIRRAVRQSLRALKGDQWPSLTHATRGPTVASLIDQHAPGGSHLQIRIRSTSSRAISSFRLS